MFCQLGIPRSAQAIDNLLLSEARSDVARPGNLAEALKSIMARCVVPNPPQDEPSARLSSSVVRPRSGSAVILHQAHRVAESPAAADIGAVSHDERHGRSKRYIKVHAGRDDRGGSARLDRGKTRWCCV